jgi:hypothetical protein
VDDSLRQPGSNEKAPGRLRTKNSNIALFGLAMIKVSLEHGELIDICRQWTGRRIIPVLLSPSGRAGRRARRPKSTIRDVMASPVGVQVLEWTNPLPEPPFMISKAALMPTEHDASSAVDRTNIVVDPF